MDDLNRIIEFTEEAVEATPHDHPDRAARLNSLGGWLSRRFEQTGALDDLNRAVMVTTEAVDATPPDHPDRAAILINLGSLFNIRFEQTGAIDDLDQAVMVTNEAVDATTPDHHNQATILNNLGGWLSRRFERTGLTGDLDRATKFAEEAVNATPPGHPDRAHRLTNLGYIFVIRFEQAEIIDDLNLAIKFLKEAVEATTHDYPNRARQLTNLGNILGMRFKWTGAINDLDRAIEFTEEAVEATPHNHPDRAAILHNLGSWLSRRFERTRAIEDLNRAAKATHMAQVAGGTDLDETVTITTARDSIFTQTTKSTHSSHSSDEVEPDMKRDLEKGIPETVRMKQVSIWVYEQLQRQVDSAAEKLVFTQLLEKAQRDLSNRHPDMITKQDVNIETKSSGGMKMDTWGTGSPDLLPADAIANTLGADRRERVDELRGWFASISRAVSILIWIKRKFPATTKANGDLYELQGEIDTVAESKDLVSKLEETIPAIASLIHTVSRTCQDELPKKILSERYIRETEEGLQELRTMVGRIINTWDVRFFTDLNDFCKLDNPIDSVLTVTGSCRDAFAGTAACYVRWHWGQKGIDILNWLSQFLLAALWSRPYTSYPLRIHGKDEDSDPVCIELQGQLNDKSAVLLSKCNVAIRVRWISGRMENYYDLVAEVASQLAWIVAALREPPEESMSLTRAKIEDRFTTGHPSQNYGDPRANFWVLHDDAPDLGLEEDNGTCWHQLFTGLNVAVGFPIPRRPDGMRGVELPFSLMTTFANIGYAIKYKGGLILKGWQNALFPVRTDSDSGLSSTTSAIQWHLFSSERHRLYMAEAKKRKPDLVPIKTEFSQADFSTAVGRANRHFLGLYQQSRIHIGTNSSQRDIIGPVSITNDLGERRLRIPVEWTRAINLSVGGGALGGSAGVSTSIRLLKKKDRLLSLDVQRTQRGLINATQTNSTILYDMTAKIAWMLPQICVIMHLVQAWAKQNYLKAQINYPTFEDMTPSGLDYALQQFWRQNAAEKAHIDLEATFTYFAHALDRLQDDEDLKPAKRLHRRRLAGVDFAELAGQPKTFSILTLNIDVASGGDWLRVLNSDWKDYKTPEAPYRVVALFCNNLNPQPILPVVPVCDTWFPPPVGQDYLIIAMHCLKRLTTLYGTDPVNLSRKHHWKRGLYTPYQDCSGRSCNRLQNIVKGRPQRDTEISNMISTAHPHAAVVFGLSFNMNPQRLCTQVVLRQQQPAPPPQAILDPA